LGSRRHKSKLIWFVLVAVALHAWVLRQQLPEALVSVPTTHRIPIEIESLDEEKQLVQSQRAERSIPNQDKAKYGEEFSQRVEKQTRAPRKGLLAQGGSSSAASDAPGAPSEQPQAELGDQAVAPKGGAGPKLSDLMALGASPDELPDDIALGENTVLSTDSVSYASFMKRITDEIYQPWVHYATRAIEGIRLDKQHLGANIYTTRLAVWMDDSGRVTAIKTLKSSGVPALDDAPKRAFWDQDPFPNPPEQMRRSDGSIRFVYEFHFEYKTSGFNITPWAI
jgi:TonB family protein